MSPPVLQLKTLVYTLVVLVAPSLSARQPLGLWHIQENQDAAESAFGNGEPSNPIVMPIVYGPKAKHTATIIMLHGLSQSGARWADFGAVYGSSLPHVKWIFPTAPTRAITIKHGMRKPGWFDVFKRDRLSRSEDLVELKQSKRYVHGLIADEVAAGIPANRIVVTGFSQGGALALLALRYSMRLAGVLALSTYLPMVSSPPLVSKQNTPTPVLMCHGTKDTTVYFDFGKLSYERLRAGGANITFQSYEGLAHNIYPEEMQSIMAFWQQCLPPG